ncbi:DUF1403 family protein [Mesorhizobium sp. M0870]|uniref:DUF1403 family protein n=1 Tax=Mesorhizobium sp. M0870 TaxID=2957016 RepID=UPI0033398B18
MRRQSQTVSRGISDGIKKRWIDSAPSGEELVVEEFLSNDAIVASENIAGMGDRSRRLPFHRLIEFGAVRELTGSSAFGVFSARNAWSLASLSSVNAPSSPDNADACLVDRYIQPVYFRIASASVAEPPARCASSNDTAFPYSEIARAIAGSANRASRWFRCRPCRDISFRGNPRAHGGNPHARYRTA